MNRLGAVLWLVAGGLTGLRLLVANHVELIPEEAYYWTYSQNLALSYFDHPPLVAWTIRAGTLLFGNTELGVRFVNILLWVATGLCLWFTARRWFAARVAVGAALFYTLLPIFVGTGFLVTPDGPLLFCWAATLLALTLALQTQRRRYWLLAGVAFGGALLSKYYGVLLAPSLLIFLLLSPRYRFWLRKPQPWVAVGLAGLLFSPVIWWNAQNDWASFAFQAGRSTEASGSRLEDFGKFWLAQFGLVTPLGFAVLVATAWRAVRRGWQARDDSWNFVASFGLPVFGLFGVASIITDAQANWTAPALLALAPGAAAIWVAGLDTGGRWWRTGTWVMGGLGLLTIVGFHFGISGQAGRFGYTHAGGWRALAAQVATEVRRVEQATGQRPFVIGADKYNLAAELGFYLGEPAECVNLYAFGARGLGYRYWTDLAKFEGRPAIVVALNLRPSVVEELRGHFVKTGAPVTRQIDAPGKRWENVRLVVGYGYRAAEPALTGRGGHL